MIYVFTMKAPGAKAKPDTPVRAVVKANGLFQARQTFQHSLTEGLDAASDYEVLEVPVHGAPSVLCVRPWGNEDLLAEAQALLSAPMPECVRCGYQPPVIAQGAISD